LIALRYTGPDPGGQGVANDVLLGEPGFKVVGFGHQRIMANKKRAGPVRSPERDMNQWLPKPER
jgi:hypothetical protein